MKLEEGITHLPVVTQLHVQVSIIEKDSHGDWDDASY